MIDKDVNIDTAEDLSVQATEMDKEWDGPEREQKECDLSKVEPGALGSAGGSALLPLDHAAPLHVCVSWNNEFLGAEPVLS